MAAKVLVVEDNPDVMFVLLSAVDSQHCEFMGIEEGTTVLQTALEQRPHLIIIDIMLPGMNGLEVCREIRQTPAIADTKVLGISGHVSARDVEPGLFDKFMEKPFDVSVLVKTMAEMLDWPETRPLDIRDDTVLPDQDDDGPVDLTWEDGDQDDQ